MTERASTAALPDVQAGVPETGVSLSRVGITGVEKILRVRAGEGEELFFAEIESVVDLGRDQAGVHMSRFEEVINEAIDEVVLGEVLRAEGLAAHIAERVRERQGGLRAEVSIAARFGETVPAPVSGIPTQEIYRLFGTAVSSEHGTRTLTGVEAQGMTACPCAQGLVGEAARTRLAGHGYSEEQIAEILEAVPVATHNQRGIGRLYIGSTEKGGPEIDARTLLRIVESSMSSEIYELMKRSDEQHVVEKAHRQPRFVEDVVREMLRQAVAELDGLGDDTFVMARQENLETIHRHNVVAERYGLLGEIAAEIGGAAPAAHPQSMREWLEAPAS